MIESMSQTRRIQIQLTAKTTEELVSLRDRLLAVGHDQTAFIELVQEELKKRKDFLPVK